jgi:hypothetical protein
LPSGQKAITSKWIFKEKVGPSRKVEKLKDKLITKDFMQTKGIDFYGTFVPIIKWSALELLYPLPLPKSSTYISTM